MALGLLVALGGAVSFAWAAERATPSGLPVPRYVSLKFDEVNARAGPGDDHRMLWIYRVKGLPVQVVAETAEWRRVCDPQGGLAWVHKRTTDGKRMVIGLSPKRVPLRGKPREEAAIKAYLNPRALATLIKCDKGWCRIRADGETGWAPRSSLWGTDEHSQCR